MKLYFVSLYTHLICVFSAYHRPPILCLSQQLLESSPKMLSEFLLILKIELYFSTNPCNAWFSARSNTKYRKKSHLVIMQIKWTSIYLVQNSDIRRQYFHTMTFVVIEMLFCGGVIHGFHVLLVSFLHRYRKGCVIL